MPLIAIGFINFTIIDIIDIAVVAALIYVILRWVRGTSAMNIIAAIIVILLTRVISDTMGMKMVSAILGAVIDVGTVALVVIFQPEIRQFLYKVGRRTFGESARRTYLAKLLGRQDDALKSAAIDEIAQACFEMAEVKCGALIVLRGRDNLSEILATGDALDSNISRPLIENIFFKNSPLHDGALVVGTRRLLAARCTLPISSRQDIPARYGMRHKAAVGLSEKTDARVIVVSEQTGNVAFVKDGKIETVSNINTLKLLIENDERKAGEQAGV